MEPQALEDDITLLKGTVALLTQRLALQEQIGMQLRQAQQQEAATLRGVCLEHAKLKSQLAMLSIRQTSMEEQGKSESGDGELPLLIKKAKK